MYPAFNKHTCPHPPYLPTSNFPSTASLTRKLTSLGPRSISLVSSSSHVSTDNDGIAIPSALASRDNSTSRPPVYSTTARITFTHCLPGSRFSGSHDEQRAETSTLTYGSCICFAGRPGENGTLCFETRLAASKSAHAVYGLCDTVGLLS